MDQKRIEPIEREDAPKSDSRLVSRFVADCVLTPKWPPTLPSPKDGRIRNAVAHPSFLPFLTLDEQIQAVLRFRGFWREDGPSQIERTLRDLSVPGPQSEDELLAWSRIRPGHASWTPDVSWRVGLAQELVTDFEATPPQLVENSWLLVALDFGKDWPEQVREHVGRFLSGWSRRRGFVRLLTNDVRFIENYADASGLPTSIASTSDELVSAVDVSWGSWSWAIWMTIKEAGWRPFWLSKWVNLSALSVGFVAHAWISALETPTYTSVRAILTLVLVLFCLLLQEKLWDAGVEVSRWYGLDGKWSNPQLTRKWKCFRTFAASIEAFVLCLMGSGLAVLIDTIPQLTSQVIAVDILVATVSALLTLIWIMWGPPRWALRPFAALGRWLGSL